MAAGGLPAGVLAATINGTPGTQLEVSDRGLHYGDGLFETIAVVGAEPLHLEFHAQRLLAGCAALGLPSNAARTLLEEGRALARGRARAVLKLLLTRGGGGRGYAAPARPRPSRIALLYPWPEHDPQAAVRGVRVRVCDTRLGMNPRLAGLKHLNRLEQVMARRELAPGESEGIMCDTAGCAIEGTMSNLFLVINGRLVTPDLSNSGVAGVTRARILDLARDAGWPVAIRPVSRQRLDQAREMFLTNSIIGVWPVRRIGKRILKPGPATRRVRELLAGR